MSLMAAGLDKRSDGRQRLMESAERLFPMGGYSRVSISMILEASDLRAPSLYHHYGDKENLYVTWAVSSMERIGFRLREIRPGQGREATFCAIVEALVAGPEINFLHMTSELDLLADAGSTPKLEGAFAKEVLTPIIRLIEPFAPKDKESKALFLANTAMLLHPSYKGALGGYAARDIARHIYLDEDDSLQASA